MNTLPYADVAAAFEVRDGALYWKISRGHSVIGSRVGRLDKHGYRKLVLHGKYLLEHRVIWLLSTGEWPASCLDHINGVRSDNRISNLRVCSLSENARNKKPLDGKKNGVKTKGVTFHKQTGKYQVYCETKYLGLFATEEEAARIYDAEAVNRFGEFARPNFEAKP